MKLKKILIIGIVASGKTTLAKQLSEILHIPWYELDCIVHYKTGAVRYKRTADEQLGVIHDIDQYGEWIFEGVDRSSYRCLFDMADTILFLDPPLWKRRIRIFTRFLKQNLGIETCDYKPDLKMLSMMYTWTRDFEEHREEFESRLIMYKDKVIRLYDNPDLSALKNRLHPIEDRAQ